MMTSLSSPVTDARKFYRDALTASFRYSGLLAARTGRHAEEIVDSAEFAALVADTRPESLEAARRIGDMAVVHLSAASARWPWWKELLAYERAYFLQAASADQRLVTYFPRRGVAATSVHFTWDLPQLLQRIGGAAETGAADQSPGDVPRHDITLLFSRAPEGRICVIELEKPAAAVFRFTNGMRKKEQIAEAAGMPLADVEDILQALAQIGAVENL